MYVTRSHACRDMLVRGDKEGSKQQRLYDLFHGKTLITVIAGQMVEDGYWETLKGKVAADGWRVWLPDRSGFALGDAVFNEEDHVVCSEEGGGSEGPAGGSPTVEYGQRGGGPTSAAACSVALWTRQNMHQSHFQGSRRRFKPLPGRVHCPRVTVGGGSSLKLGLK